MREFLPILTAWGLAKKYWLPEMITAIAVSYALFVFIMQFIGPPFPANEAFAGTAFDQQMVELAKKCKGEFVIQMVSSDKEGDKIILTCSEDRRVWK